MKNRILIIVSFLLFLLFTFHQLLPSNFQIKVKNALAVTGTATFKGSSYQQGTAGIWSSGGNIGIGTTSPGALLEIAKNDASTNTQIELQRLTRTTSETAADNIGFLIQADVENDSGGVTSAAQWGGTLRDANVATKPGGEFLVKTWRDSDGQEGLWEAMSVYVDGANKWICGNSARENGPDCFGFTLGAANDIILTYDGTSQVYWNWDGSTFETKGAHGASKFTTLEAAPIYFDTSNNGANLYIASGGNVGIGTTVPGAELHIAGTTPEVRIGDDDAEDTSISYMGNAQDYYIGLDDTNDSLTVGLGTAVGTTPYMTVNSSGNVGIGTTGPEYLLQIDKAAAGAIGPQLFLRNSISSATAGHATEIIMGAVNNRAVRMRSVAQTQYGRQPQLQFLTDTDANADGTPESTDVRMLIANNGYVGIGTTSPGASLDVEGAVEVNLSGTYATHVCHSGGVLSSCSSAAELAPMEDNVETGDVIALKPDTPNPVNDQHAPFMMGKANPDDPNVLGVAIAPELGGDGEKKADFYRGMAIYGYFPVKVSSENGLIKRGDYLAVSSILPGYAKKAAQAGMTIGVALEDQRSDSDKIQTYVLNTWYDPDLYLTDTGELKIIREDTGTYALHDKNSSLVTRIGAFAEIVVAKLRVGLLEAKKIVVDGLDVAKQIKELRSISEKQQQTINSLQKQINELKKQIEELKK